MKQSGNEGMMREENEPTYGKDFIAIENSVVRK